MRVTRRTTIIGIGALAVGAGAIGGSGAFDSVEANRSFEVDVSGDAGALLGLEATNEIIAGTQSGGAGDNDIIYFELDSAEAGGEAALNENAVTEFFDTMRVTNNGNRTVELTFDFGEMQGVAFILADERNADSPTDLTEEAHELGSGDSELLDLRINTRSTDDDEDGGYVEPPEGEPYQITIRAESIDQ